MVPEIRLLNARIIRYGLGVSHFMYICCGQEVSYTGLYLQGKLDHFFSDPGRIKSKLNVFSLLYMSMMCVVLLALDVQ